jgi:hypothetical protein
MRISMQSKIFSLVSVIIVSSILPILAAEKKIPDDISFCIADLKYDGKNLKVLEFGDCGQSLFNGHDALYGRGSVWERFWNYLARFNLPVWYVGHAGKSTGSDALDRIGGQSAQSVVRLQGIIEADARAKGLRNLKNYQAIVFIRRDHQRPAIEAMRRKFSSILFVNQVAYTHIVNKHNTHLLFQDDHELKACRPVCKSCKKRYTPSLAQSIIDEMNSDLYVVKPTDGSRGRGVIFVTKDELDVTLKTILYDREMLRKMSNQSPYCYGFWLLGKAKNFLVEEYVPSKTITVDGKQYDATMRLVFVTYRINGKVGVDILGAYWKLPAKAISEQGSFVDKHRSDIHGTASVSSAKVSAQDLKAVSTLFCPMMEKIYHKMLTQYYGE